MTTQACCQTPSVTEPRRDRLSLQFIRVKFTEGVRNFPYNFDEKWGVEVARVPSLTLVWWINGFVRGRGLNFPAPSLGRKAKGLLINKCKQSVSCLDFS